MFEMLHAIIITRNSTGQNAPPFKRKPSFGSFSCLRAIINEITTIKIVIMLNKTPRLIISLTIPGNRQMTAETIITTTIETVGWPFFDFEAKAFGSIPSSAAACIAHALIETTTKIVVIRAITEAMLIT